MDSLITTSLQRELEAKEQRLRFLQQTWEPGMNPPKFAGSDDDSESLEDLVADVEDLRRRLLLQKQHEYDARVLDEGVQWLKENEHVTPVHTRAPVDYTTPLRSAYSPSSDNRKVPSPGRRQTTEPSKSTSPFPSGGVSLGKQLPLTTTRDWKLTWIGNSFGSTSSTDQMGSVASSPKASVINPRKRPRESLSSPMEYPAKSTRPSPSPALTTVTTPSSFDFDFGALGDSEDLKRLLGGDPREQMRASGFQACIPKSGNSDSLLGAPCRSEGTGRGTT